MSLSTPAVILNKVINVNIGADLMVFSRWPNFSDGNEKKSAYVAQYYVFSIVAYENIFKINVRQVQPTPWMIPPKPYSFAAWRL